MRLLMARGPWSVNLAFVVQPPFPYYRPHIGARQNTCPLRQQAHQVAHGLVTRRENCTHTKASCCRSVFLRHGGAPASGNDSGEIGHILVCKPRHSEQRAHAAWCGHPLLRPRLHPTRSGKYHPTFASKVLWNSTGPRSNLALLYERRASVSSLNRASWKLREY